MLAVDTNVVVRFIVRDDAAQAQQALLAFSKETIWIAKTVLLQVEWVLRSVYQYAPARIAGALRTVGSVPAVVFEDSDACWKALQWFGDGLDFAGALHLASCAGVPRLATFDRRFARQARNLTTVEIVTL